MVRPLNRHPGPPGRADRSAEFGEQRGDLGRFHRATQGPTDRPAAHNFGRTTRMQVATSAGKSELPIDHHASVCFHPGQPDQFLARHRSPTAEAGSQRLVHGPESRQYPDPQPTPSHPSAGPQPSPIAWSPVETGGHMENRAKIGLGIAGTVVALGAAVGVGSYAAGLVPGGTEAGAPVGGYGQGPDGQAEGRSGPGRGGFDSTELAASLAAKLGVDQAQIEAALKEVLPAGRPSGAPSMMPSAAPTARPSGQPDDQGGSGTGGSQRWATLATSLAEKLNLDEAKVLAALQEVMASRGDLPSATPTSS